MMSSLNSPPIVAAAGAAAIIGLPFAAPVVAAAPLALLRAMNIAAFGLNVAAVSVPGRLDSEVARQMLDAEGDGAEGDGAPLVQGDSARAGSAEASAYTPTRGRTLVMPSGWAFAIWGPIYVGEALLMGAQCLDVPPLAAALPQLTAPFVAANVCQSLWCAAFRPSYSSGWHKYVSVAMLGGTAFSLAHAHAVCPPALAAAPYFVPLTMHWGWTTAATLVNLNGSIAMDAAASDKLVVGAGHASALAAGALGVGLTMSFGAPVYGLTVAWALVACADGMQKRLVSAVASPAAAERDVMLVRAARVQKRLCQAGATLCVVASGCAMYWR